ncbi:MAG: TolC family protein, partial [Polyangiaceae bacterium]
LTSLLNLPNRERAGRHRLAAGKAAVVKRAVEVAYAAKRAFVQAVAAEQALALQRSNLAAAVASAEAAAQLLEAGNVARLVLVNEQAMVEELRIAVSDAEANNVMAKQRLAAAIALESGDGMPPLPKALPKMPEEEADMKRLARLAAMGNLDLVRLEAEYAAAASRADAAELAAWLPHLVAGVNLDRGGGAWSAGPVVGMAIPLFDQGQGPIGIAEAQMERADADHRVVAVRVDRAVKSAVTRLAVRRAQVKQFEEKLLPLRDAVLDQTLLQYNAMSLGVFQLLQARRDQIRARTSYIGVMREYWKARLDLEQLARGSLPPDAAMMSSVDVSGPGGGGEDH